MKVVCRSRKLEEGEGRGRARFDLFSEASYFRRQVGTVRISDSAKMPPDVACAYIGRVDHETRFDGAANLRRIGTIANETAPTACRASPLRGATFVAMMQSTDLGDRHNLACTRWLDRSFVRCVLLKTQVRTVAMIIVAERE
jgi:hypothetical protein